MDEVGMAWTQVGKLALDICQKRAGLHGGQAQ